MIFVAEASIDAGVAVKKPAEEPKQIGEAVEIGEHLGLHFVAVFVFTNFGEANGATFGAATDGSSQLKGGGRNLCSGKRPVGEDAIERFDAVNLFGERIDVGGGERGGGFAAGRRCRQRGSDLEESALDLFGGGADGFVGAEAARESEGGVQLIDGAVGLDAKVSFGDA